jgi:hypothetical protein
MDRLGQHVRAQGGTKGASCIVGMYCRPWAVQVPDGYMHSVELVIVQ